MYCFDYVVVLFYYIVINCMYLTRNKCHFTFGKGFYTKKTTSCCQLKLYVMIVYDNNRSNLVFWTRTNPTYNLTLVNIFVANKHYGVDVLNPNIQIFN